MNVNIHDILIKKKFNCIEDVCSVNSLVASACLHE